MSEFDLPQGANEAVDSMGSVALPFAAPIVYWRSGSKALKTMKNEKGVARFGGWAIQPTELETYKGQIPDTLPVSFEEVEFSGEGEVYKNYVSRVVYFAPFAKRFKWFKKDNGGSQSVTQFVGYMGEMTEGKILPWGPIVLQARSLYGKAIETCVSNFAKFTAKFRGDAKTAYFYMPIGSFGDTPVFVTRKGKNGETNEVTDPQDYHPEGGYTMDLVRSLYVGKDIASEIMTFAPLTKEWVSDWRKDEEKLPPMPEVSEEFPFGEPA
jgi:hypothetical protein